MLNAVVSALPYLASSHPPFTCPLSRSCRLVVLTVVARQGLADETRNPFKLVLHCIMILTSVIPPELPIELSLAVINSLTALTQSLIFCTEPFRIPLAGKVDVCCFDKTGTLTSDNLVMKGVAGAPGTVSTVQTTAGVHGNDVESQGDDTAGDGGGQPPEAFCAPAKLAAPACVLGEVPTRILAGCHSLVTLNGTLVGDSVEVSTLTGLGWACLRGGIVVPRAAARAARAAAVAPPTGTAVGSAAATDAALWPIQIVRAWQFDPCLRRMCTAIRLVSMSGIAGGGVGNGSAVPSPKDADGNSDGDRSAANHVPPFHDRLWVVAKGAPESMEPLLIDAPANYRSTFLHHMGQGSRVLAMAYRALDPGTDVDGCRSMQRSVAEKGLRFGGFLVLGCPIKPDAPYVVRELRESSHTVAMITGDSVLTAAHVAKQVGMIDQPTSRTLVLAVVAGEGDGGRGAAVNTSRDADERGKYTSSAAKLSRAGGSLAAEVRESVPQTSATSDGRENCGSLCWVPLTVGFDGSSGGGKMGSGDSDSGGSNGSNIPFDVRTLETLAERHALCVTGDALTQVSANSATAPIATNAQSRRCKPSADLIRKATKKSSRKSPSPLSALCSHVTVFARVSPAQKEEVIGQLNAAGRTTLMCGDGTNDVGALRLAHVGVSIVNSPELEKRLEGYLNGDAEGVEKGGSGGDRKNQRPSESMRSRMLASREREEQEMDPALVKLGDASIASPFTAKTTSVGCVLAVIRQGRCTLVTTLQVYKVRSDARCRAPLGGRGGGGVQLSA